MDERRHPEEPPGKSPDTRDHREAGHENARGRNGRHAIDRRAEQLALANQHGVPDVRDDHELERIFARIDANVNPVTTEM